MRCCLTNRRPTTANTWATPTCQPGQWITHTSVFSLKRASWGEIVYLSLQAEKMVVLCLSGTPTPPNLSTHTPMFICCHYVPLPPTVGPWLWCPRGQCPRGGDGGESQVGGTLLLKRLEQSIANHQMPQGPPWPLTTLTLVEMSSSMGMEGGGQPVGS